MQWGDATICAGWQQWRARCAVDNNCAVNPVDPEDIPQYTTPPPCQPPHRVSSGNATLQKRLIMPSRIRGRSQFPCSWYLCINMIRKSIMLRSRRDSWKDKYGGLGSYFRCHLTLPGPWRGKTGDTWFIIRWRPTDTSETTWSVSVDTWGDVCGSLDQIGTREATFDQLKMAHCTGIGELTPEYGYQPPHKITLHPRLLGVNLSVRMSSILHLFRHFNGHVLRFNKA